MTTLTVVPELTREVTVREDRVNRPHFDVYENNDCVLRLSVVDSNGSAADISTWTVRSFGVYPAGSSSAHFTGTPSFETDGTDGILLVTMTDAQLTGFYGKQRIEVQVENAGATVKKTLVRGTLTMTATYVS